jgi:hypothetical protein
VLNLTDAERRILINQSRILAALYPFEAAEFERAANPHFSRGGGASGSLTV